jgi:type II secretory pathway predicted ATPase ExeA
VTVDESRKKRPLADDPSFISSLSDLDRGLTSEREDEFSEDATKISAPARRLRRRRIVRRRRPLASGAAPARAPSPASGTATPTVSARPAPTPPSPTAGVPVPVAVPVAPVPVARPAPNPPTPPAPAPVPADFRPYETFYGLSESPFSLSTDPVFLYHTTAHDRTAQVLLTSIGTRPGVVVITGPFGIGKTSLCRAVIEELDRRTLTSFLVDPFLSVDELLQTLLIDFGALSRADLASGRQPSTNQLRDTLQSFLASLSSLQASAVALIDEAQNLPAAVLDELRALSEITDGRRLLHVVLVGEPGLVSLLKQEALRPLNAQVAVRSVLGPLLADEVDGYVRHRLGVVGNSSRVEFSGGALARIHELTRGVPRVVNILCDRAMSRGYEVSASVIDRSHVDAAASDLDLSVPVAQTPRTLRLAVEAVAFVLLMLVGAGAALWVFRDDVHRTLVQWERVPPTPSAPRIPQTAPLRVPPQP